MESGTALAAYLAVITGISMAGGLAPLYRVWSQERLTLLAAAGAGVLLGASLLQMTPQAVLMLGPSAGAALMLGFLVIFLAEEFLHSHPESSPSRADRPPTQPFGTVAFVGISLHSLLDGLAVGTSLMVPSLMPAVLIAIALHKVPTAFSLCSILLLAGYSRLRTAVHIFGFSLATPLGAVVAYLGLTRTSEEVVAAAIGLSAGSFLAIATCDLLPQVQRGKSSRFAALAFFLAGVAASALAELAHG